MLNPLTGLTTGLRCWPQWKNWGFCYLTGALQDPCGQLYSPYRIQAGELLQQLHELRERVIFADCNTIAKVLSTTDMQEPDYSIRGLQERARKAHEAVTRKG